MRDACTRLQDEINTILCKRARLIARGKASGISGIPNKLTLNAEGSPLPPFHLREPSASSGASHLRSWMGKRTTRRNIYRCPRNTRRIPISPNSYFAYTPLCRLEGIERKTIWERVLRKLCIAPLKWQRGDPATFHALRYFFEQKTRNFVFAFITENTIWNLISCEIVQWTQNINK